MPVSVTTIKKRFGEQKLPYLLDKTPPLPPKSLLDSNVTDVLWYCFSRLVEKDSNTQELLSKTPQMIDKLLDMIHCACDDHHLASPVHSLFSSQLAAITLFYCTFNVKSAQSLVDCGALARMVEVTSKLLVDDEVNDTPLRWEDVDNFHALYYRVIPKKHIQSPPFQWRILAWEPPSVPPPPNPSGSSSLDYFTGSYFSLKTLASTLLSLDLPMTFLWVHNTAQYWPAVCPTTLLTGPCVRLEAILSSKQYLTTVTPHFPFNIL